jgi:hypothetical protein
LSSSASWLQTVCLFGCSVWFGFGLLSFLRFEFGSFFVRHFSKASANMSVKLYVGNIPWQTSVDQLRELFARYGNVEASAAGGC